MLSVTASVTLFSGGSFEWRIGLTGGTSGRCVVGSIPTGLAAICGFGRRAGFLDTGKKNELTQPS